MSPLAASRNDQDASGPAGELDAAPSQLYFDDGLYRNGGHQLMLDVSEAGDGYAATFDVGLQFG